MKEENIVELIFKVASKLDIYKSEFGILPIYGIDNKIKKYIEEKFSQINKKFVEGYELTNEEIKWLREASSEIESLYSQRLME